MSTTTPHASSSEPSETATDVVAELEADVVQVFVEMAKIVGLPRSYAEIYGLLFASPRPLSFTDIYERLGLSKGSVSMGLKALREIGAIRPAEGADWRREHYVAETALRTLIGGLLRESVQPQLQRGTERLEAMKTRHRALLAADNDTSRLLSDRIAQLDTWHRKGGTLLPLISKFLG